MTGKITLITPPDFFENTNTSILFANITDSEQDVISSWLYENQELTKDLNLYVYSGETNVSWFLYALSRCEYKYFNIDNVNYISQALSGYALGKRNSFYSTESENLVAVFSHINSNRVDSVETFLQRIFGDKTAI